MEVAVSARELYNILINVEIDTYNIYRYNRYVMISVNFIRSVKFYLYVVICYN